MSATFPMEALADPIEQASPSLSHRPSWCVPTTLVFSVLPVGQAFAHAVLDTHKPFLPPVYLLSAYSSLSSQLNLHFPWKPRSPPSRHALSIRCLSFPALISVWHWCIYWRDYSIDVFPEDSLRAETTWILFAFAYHSTPEPT